MAFDTLSLDPKILKALAEAGYSTPTDIQKEAIPVIASGRDLRASAQTGTGKTAAFLLPALTRLAKEQSLARGPRLLILSPTRELAMQIETQAKKYSQYLKKMKSVCICGGVPYRVQMKRMARPYEILIATPGRLIDYIQQGKIDLSTVETLVLDEADRMLDMGFLEPVEEIVEQISGKRQTLLFSATLKGPILKLSQRLLKEPQDVVIAAKTTTHENIEQKLHYVDDLRHKNRLLDHVLGGMEQTIIFTSTKRHADELVRQLKEKGQKAAALHGDMRQGARTRTIEKLRQGSISVLVATDVAARGIDVSTVTHVVNYDLPRNAEDYVHRIGRTGRAGAKGTALSFVCSQDRPLLKRIEKFTGEQIAVFEEEGFEPSPQKSAPKKPKGMSAPKRPRGAGAKRPGSQGAKRSGGWSGEKRSGGQGARSGAKRFGDQGGWSGEKRSGGQGARSGAKRSGDQGGWSGEKRSGGQGARSGAKRPGGKSARPGAKRSGGWSGERRSEGQRAELKWPAGPGGKRSGGKSARPAVKRSGGQGGWSGEKRSGGQGARSGAKRPSFKTGAKRGQTSKQRRPSRRG